MNLSQDLMQSCIFPLALVCVAVYLEPFFCMVAVLFTQHLRRHHGESQALPSYRGSQGTGAPKVWALRLCNITKQRGERRQWICNAKRGHIDGGG